MYPVKLSRQVAEYRSALTPEMLECFNEAKVYIVNHTHPSQRTRPHLIPPLIGYFYMHKRCAIYFSLTREAINFLNTRTLFYPEDDTWMP